MRGRDEPVWVWAATSADGRPPAQVAVTPLVGRDHELELLENTFARAVRDRRAHLFTVYGEPGVGKSRLANEFLASLEGTTILKGRCLPYGESITYWPLAEMVKGAADIADDDPLDVAIEKLRECCPAEAVADLLGLATGVLEAVHGERSQQEISWAAREWAQLMAQTQPLILVFEDIHWAEDPLLELIEHMTDWVRDGSLLIVCLARPELLDIRSDWGGGRVRATSIELEPLGAADSELLIDALSGDDAISAKTKRALLEKTDGNPLFLEEVMLTVAECGEERAATGIPDTVQALIAARIDRLDGVSKSVLQRASVIGRRLLGRRDRASVERRGRRGGDRRPPAPRPRRGRVALVAQERDGLPLQARAHPRRRVREPHEVGAREAPRDASPSGSVSGPATSCSRSGRTTSTTPRRSSPSSTAPLRPTWRARQPRRSRRPADARSPERRTRPRAISFLRAVELEPTLNRRYIAAKAAWRLDDLPAVAREMEAVREESVRIGDKNLEGKALTALADMVLMREADPIRARELAEQALAVIGDDPPARFDALRVAGTPRTGSGTSQTRSTMSSSSSSWRGRPAGRISRASPSSRGRTRTPHGSTSTTARAKLERTRESSPRRAARSTRRGRVSSAWTKIYLLSGELEQAEEAFAEAERLFSEAGAVWAVARALNMGAWVAWESGDLEKAEKRFRESIRLLKPIGDRATLCESQRGLAELLLARGRVEEAERFALDARETVGPLDVTSRATTAGSLARCARPRVATTRPRRSSARRSTPSPTPTSARSRTRCSARTFSSCATEDATTSAEPLEERLAELLPAPRRAPPESPDVTPRPAPR